HPAAQPAHVLEHAPRRRRRRPRLSPLPLPDGGRLPPLRRAPPVQLVRVLLRVGLSDQRPRQRRLFLPAPRAARRRRAQAPLLRDARRPRAWWTPGDR